MTTQFLSNNPFIRYIDRWLQKYPILKGIAQICLIFTVWGVAVWLVNTFELPISSGVMGLFIMLALLFSGVLKLSWVNVGSKMLLGELVLMFIPLMMSITQYKDLFIHEGWQLLLTIIFSTAMVMLSSALTFMLCNRLQRHLYRKSMYRKSHTKKLSQNI